MFLQDMTIEDSWSDDRREYLAKPTVARWENCREQGYIVSLATNVRQLNIAFFEHRNSDSICAVMWEQSSMNSITIENARFGDVYKDKFDVSHKVGYGRVLEMANWINEQFCVFWNQCSPVLNN